MPERVLGRKDSYRFHSAGLFGSTFEFVELLPQLGSCQLMDAVRDGVLVVQRLVAGVHDGGAVELGDVPDAATERNAARNK